jgi:hypothetical protein
MTMRAAIELALGGMICCGWVVELPGATAEQLGKQTEGQFETEVVMKVRMDYLLFLPGTCDQKESWPLLVFLHGAGERGEDVCVNA